ncbi:hypothetical protein A258_11555, partial [Pseudomonas syringae pv. actinidiae ICMP 19104]
STASSFNCRLGMWGSWGAYMIFTQRALCDLVSRRTVIQGETSLSVGKYLSLIQATQFSPRVFFNRW